jgi:hypothetical protein
MRSCESELQYLGVNFYEYQTINIYVDLYVFCPRVCSGFAVGIYTTNSPDACQYVAGNCDANIIIVENDAQLQKILAVRDRLPCLKAIIQYTGKPKEDYPNVYSVRTLTHSHSMVTVRNRSTFRPLESLVWKPEYFSQPSIS